MGRKQRVHMATDRVRVSVCGWVEVDCEADVSRVTCKACLAAVSKRRVHGARAHALGWKAAMLGEAIREALTPSADFPPRLTPPVWASSCRAWRGPRCGACVLCLWEAEATRWNAVRPWTEVCRRGPILGTPRWGSLRAALVDLVLWERDGRAVDSAFGRVLSRLRLGELGDDGSAPMRDGRMVRRADDVVAVRKALERAYPDGAHRLSQAHRIGLLVVRVAGLLTPTPSYEELSAALGESEGELRALVRAGRREVMASLEDRGLIRVVEGRHRKPECSVMRVEMGAAV